MDAADSTTTEQSNMRLVRCSRLERAPWGGWIVGMIGDVRAFHAAHGVLARNSIQQVSPGCAWWVGDEQIERIAEQIPAVRWRLTSLLAYEHRDQIIFAP